MLLAQAGLVAERMGTKASAVARLESALVSGKHSPSIDTWRKKPFAPNYAV
ncbi:MAG: helix-turn-helix transcriptional regulator [Methylobacter sp.]|nr:helix-turn-helix transcriptional regulator [Methylobacter sp.]